MVAVDVAALADAGMVIVGVAGLADAGMAFPAKLAGVVAADVATLAAAGVVTVGVASLAKAGTITVGVSDLADAGMAPGDGAPGRPCWDGHRRCGIPCRCWGGVPGRSCWIGHHRCDIFGRKQSTYLAVSESSGAIVMWGDCTSSGTWCRTCTPNQSDVDCQYVGLWALFRLAWIVQRRLLVRLDIPQVNVASVEGAEVSVGKHFSGLPGHTGTRGSGTAVSVLVLPSDVPDLWNHMSCTHGGLH